MPTALEKALLREHPEVLYHYTSMDSMMKIAEKACIWATSINYLNDVSEGDHFKKLIRNRIPEYRKNHKLEDDTIFDEFRTQSDPKVDHIFERRPYVASFSEEGDSLPQWRSYCPNGNGVSIGFKTDCLERARLVDPKTLTISEDAPKASCYRVEYLDDSCTDALASQSISTLPPA